MKQAIVVTRQKKNDDELSHAKSHKYVRREKVNGKWRYWYEELGDKISDAMGVDESIELAKAKGREDYTKSKVDEAKTAYDNASASDKDKAAAQLRKAEIEYLKARTDKVSADLAYDSTPMGMYEVGRDYIKSLFSKKSNK